MHPHRLSVSDVLNHMTSHIIFFWVLFFLPATNALAQTKINAAARLITSADSVIIISHIATEEYHEKPEGIVLPPGVVSTQKPIVFPSFFLAQDINPAIIIQRCFLPKTEIRALVDVIRKPVKKLRIGFSPLCFEPHHAVLIYLKGQLSYMDICFHCKDLVTSSDLALTNMDFIDGKWNAMKAFFLKHGLTYELEENH